MNEKTEDGRSFAEVMRDKRQAAEKEIEEHKSKHEGGETVQQRAARLRAQRDLLKKQKADKREKELSEFNDKMDSEMKRSSAADSSLYDQFKKMDANTQKM